MKPATAHGWLQLRDLELVTGVPRRYLRNLADTDRLPYTQWDHGGRRLFGSEALDTLARMGVTADMARLAQKAEGEDDPEDDAA
jgi:hypothetical protein